LSIFAAKGSHAPEVPPFAKPYLALFEDLLEVLLLHDGFALIPVETPSGDIARVMADWLAWQGRHVQIVAPDEGSWNGLAGMILGLSAVPHGVAMVIGPREVTLDLKSGLRLVNQRRDSIAAHLAYPLLWCGSREFLDASWELAPDFWSIRELPRRLTHAVRVSETTGQFSLSGATVTPPGMIKMLLDAAREQGDRPNTARLGLHLARTLVAGFQLGEAEELASEALGIFSEMGGERGAHGVAKCYQTLGDIARRRYQESRAEEFYRRALSMFQQMMDENNAAETMYSLGRLAYWQDKLDAALTFYDKVIAVGQKLGDLRKQAKVLKARADVHVRRSDSAAAARDYDAALTLFQSIRSRTGEADVLKARGDLRLRQADLTGATRDYDAASILFEEGGDRLGHASVLLARGDVARSRGDSESALKFYIEAQTIYAELGARFGLSNVLAEIARIYAGTGQVQMARTAAERAKSLALLTNNAYAHEVAEDVLAGLAK
jgi:tetratricopeptide (TPR) repeat protein